MEMRGHRGGIMAMLALVLCVATALASQQQAAGGTGASNTELRQMRIHHDASVGEEESTVLMEEHNHHHHGHQHHETRHQRVAREHMRKETASVDVSADASVQPSDATPANIAPTTVAAQEDLGTEAGADKAAAEQFVCTDIPYSDRHGFGCDAYDGYRCEAGKNLTHVPAAVMASCCACGGGKIEHKAEHSFEKMDTGDGFSKCSWMNAASGQVAWKCPEGLSFVVCTDDDECKTAAASAVLGTLEKPVCQKLAGSASGLCIDRAEDPVLHVWTVTPDERDGTFFYGQHDGFLRARKVDLHEVVKDEDHFITGPSLMPAPENVSPCCCASPRTVPPEWETPIEGEALKEEVVDKLHEVEAELQRNLANKNSQRTECAAVDCSKATCPNAPPVVVVKFAATSAGGIPLTGALVHQDLLQLVKMRGGQSVLDERKEAAEMKHRDAASRARTRYDRVHGDGAQALVQAHAVSSVHEDPAFIPAYAEKMSCHAAHNEPCVALQEGDMKFDKRENAVVMSVAERHSPELKSPRLAEIDETIAPSEPECGELCELTVKSRTLFLVDRSGSTAQLQATIMSRLAPVYTDFCTGDQAPSDDVPIEKSCGLFGFDGSNQVTPIVHWANSSALPKSESAFDGVKNMKTEDHSTNLIGALKQAQEIMDKNSGKVSRGTAQTIVLVTDGEERAHREDGAAVLQDLRDSGINVLVYFVRKAWRREASSKSEQFVCRALLGREEDHCCSEDASTGCLGVDVDAYDTASTLAQLGSVSKDDEDDTDDGEETTDFSFHHGVGPVMSAFTQAAPLVTGGLQTAGAVAEFSFAGLPLFNKLEQYVREQRAEVADFKERTAKHAAWVKTHARKVETARLVREAKTNSMMDSWGKLKQVYLELYGASNYQLGFCSSYRAAEAQGSDKRTAHLHMQWTNGTLVDVKAPFSSKTFRQGHCNTNTVLAALGLSPDVDVAASADKRDHTPEASSPAPSPVATVTLAAAAQKQAAAPATTRTTKKESGAATTTLAPAVLCVALSMWAFGARTH